jgi:hypothetical protein
MNPNLFGDYKYGIQLRAEELAVEIYGEDTDYYDLPQEKRDAVYRRAEQEYFERSYGL